jgi:hypothetical protein
MVIAKTSRPIARSIVDVAFLWVRLTVLSYLLDITLINHYYASEKQSQNKSHYQLHQLIRSNSVFFSCSWVSIVAMVDLLFSAVANVFTY